MSIDGLDDQAWEDAIKSGAITKEQVDGVRRRAREDKARELAAKKAAVDADNKKWADDAPRRLKMEEESARKAQQLVAARREYKRRLAVLEVMRIEQPARYWRHYFVGPWPRDPDATPRYDDLGTGCCWHYCCRPLAGEYEPLCISCCMTAAAGCLCASCAGLLGL